MAGSGSLTCDVLQIFCFINSWKLDFVWNFPKREELFFFFQENICKTLFSIFTNNWLEIIAWLEDFRSLKYSKYA